MDYLLKSSVVIIVFYLCFQLFFKKETFFQHNRGFLLIGMVIALVFPLIVIPVYIPIDTVNLPEVDFVSVNTTQIITQVSNEAFQWRNLIPIIYGIGLVLFLIQFLFQFGSLLLLVLKNPKNKNGIYTYVTVTHNISPFSFFKWIVFNPKNFEKDELELILTHEKVHASQLHSIDILFTQLACAIFWFNPLMWLYRKSVRQNLEYIADYNTQTSSNKERTYQHLLLKTSVANHHIQLSNNFYNSSIKERIIMLKKSRSNKRNQWRYLFILPLLVVLLMSMNTKDVYIEANSTVKKSEKKLEFVVTKTTSDSELKSMSKSVEQQDGSLVFSDVKRNENNELTNIFVKLYNHSYGGGNSVKPIESFLIYKELTGLKGGYVGRLGHGTTHFGTKQINDVLIKKNETLLNAFEKRVQAATLKNGLYKEEDKKGLGDNESIEIIISKDTKDEDLGTIKEVLKSKGITFTFDDVKRNSKGEITAINTTFKSAKSSSNYNISGDDGIKSFQFKSDNDTFSVGTVNYKDKNGTKKTQSSNSHNKLIVIDDEKSSTTVDLKTLKNSDSIYYTKTNKFTFSSDDEDTTIYTHESDEPLFIINGKKVKKSLFEDVDSDDIESVFVLKGEKAFEKYGDDGKNGVILLTKKGSKNLLSDDEDTVIIKSKNEFSFETDGKEPLFILDGKVITKDDMKNISPNQIDNVEILKDNSATKLYGKKGKHGVVVINTAKTSNTNGVTTMYSENSETHNGFSMLNKNTSKSNLEQLKKDLKAHDVDVNFSKVKRNKAGEITAIKITLKDNNGRVSSATFKEKNQTIPKIIMGKKGDQLFINSIKH